MHRSNGAIVQPWKENNMWTQATCRATWVCVCVYTSLHVLLSLCAYIPLLLLSKETLSPFAWPHMQLLKKLNKRPVLCRAGCAQQGFWSGWMSFTSQVSSYETCGMLIEEQRGNTDSWYHCWTRQQQADPKGRTFQCINWGVFLKPFFLV